MKKMRRWIPLGFESDPDHHLDTKSIKDPNFPFYLLLSCFVQEKINKVLMYTIKCPGGGIHSLSALIGLCCLHMYPVEVKKYRYYRWNKTLQEERVRT